MKKHNLTDKAVAEQLYDVLDLNADGRVTFQEYVIGTAFMHVEDPLHRAYIVLKLADVNKDGKVSDQELHNVCRILIHIAAPGE